MRLEDLGYNPFFESKRGELGFADFSVARVIAEHRGLYRVKNLNGEFFAKITGKQMLQASGREDYPAVGDWVAITELDKDMAVIRGILPRETIIKRRYGDKTRIEGKSEVQIIATNIDIAFIVESVDRDYNLNRFERYFSIARDGGVVPAIIVNKVDLLSPEELEGKLAEIKNRFPEIDVIPTSVVNDTGLDDLRNYIAKGKTYCFLGSSGVGKSSLINKLLGGNAIETGDVSVYSGRGKHITTSRQMYCLSNGGIVIDNPGMREVGVATANQGINTFFDDIAELAEQCQYADCTHTHEPGCGVTEAVRLGTLDKEHYSNYINLKKEAEHYEMSDVKKREKDRRFGKFFKKTMKELKDFRDK